MTEPKTIAELIEIHGKPTPEKPLRVRRDDWNANEYFDVIADQRTYCYPGYNHNGLATIHSGVTSNWLLVEPEPEYETRCAYFCAYDSTIRYWAQPPEGDEQKLPEDQYPPIMVKVTKK